MTAKAEQTLAYSYIRFSRGVQGKEGKDSLRRQLDRTRDFCKQHGLTLVEEMKALGVSSFKGKNLEADQIFGEFLTRVKQHKIPAGSVLVVESIDRISRDKILRVQNTLTDILLNGVGIAPLSFNGEILTEDRVNKKPELLLLCIVEAMRAGNESTHKSERIQENFDQKREAIKSGKRVYFGGCMPGWVTGVEKCKRIMERHVARLN